MEAGIKKKVVFINAAVPHPYHGGGGITAYSILLSLLKRGYNLSVITWRTSFTGGRTEKELVDNLEKLGIKIFFIEDKPAPKNIFRTLSKLFFPRIEDVFPTSVYNEEFREMLSELKPDILFIYHWEGLAPVYNLNDIPKMALVGDPVNQASSYRREFNWKFKLNLSFKETVQNILTLRYTNYQDIYMKALLSNCTRCGAFAFHHAEMFREEGVSNCHYFRTPVVDPFENGKRKRSLPEKPKILMIGHLHGIVTLTGIELFVKEILPVFEKELGEDKFEVHVVGGFFETLPETLKAKLTHPSIKIRGHIAPADDEFLSSHLLLVPNPIELGIRVRILTAFSFGVPVVAHTANKGGIPELEHNKNCLLADTGEGLADEVIRILRDEQTGERLGQEGRRTYETFFSPDTAGKAIVDALEEICDGN